LVINVESVYDNISLNSSRTMTDLSDKTWRENQNTFYAKYKIYN